MSWTMVCPACQTQIDEHGYCTDCGCVNCGKTVDPIPQEWVDMNGRLLMEVRTVVVDVADDEYRTFQRAPEVRRALEECLTGMTVTDDQGTEVGWVVSGDAVLGGVGPIERTAQAIESTARQDALDRLLREPTTMDVTQLAAVEHELRRAMEGLIRFRQLGFDADALPGGRATHPLIKDVASDLDRAFDYIDSAMRSIETPEDYDIEGVL